MTMWPPEKLDAQTIDMQRSGQFLFLTSLLHFRSGWFANHALRQPGHRATVAIHASPWAGSLSLGR